MEGDSAIVISLGLYNLVVEGDSVIVILHMTKKEKDSQKFDGWLHQIFLYLEGAKLLVSFVLDFFPAQETCRGSLSCLCNLPKYKLFQFFCQKEF